MSGFHPTAIVDSNAWIGSDVEIGPYCIIGERVQIGDGCRLHSHVVIEGDTTIGQGCEIYPFACLGHIPQDLKFSGEQSKLVIGDNNRIREYVTMNPGTEGGGFLTKVGSDGLYMAQAHVAHDCRIGNNVILANSATLGGHCEVGDFAILGGLCAIHQFVRIGSHGFIGGMSGIENDIIPFGMAMGIRNGLSGLNLVGMKRQGFRREQIHTVRKAYQMLFAEEVGTLKERAEKVENIYSDDDCVMQIINFIKSDSSRSIAVPKQGTQ